MFRQMPRYWLIWLTGALYLVFAFSTHTVMAAPLARPALSAHTTLAHPALSAHTKLEHPPRAVARSRYPAGNPVRLGAPGPTWAHEGSATPPTAAGGRAFAAVP
ncbi:MAG: hypothetical protein QOF83_3590 [Solirubrobacteraceae bacterium]|jgi:hypothetical protein|nr:hypothetical protein [Solirubrobacteraceae bacterium]